VRILEKKYMHELISICGVGKAGTTQLYRLISSHNEISGSVPKQPIYLLEPECNTKEKYFSKCKFDLNKNKLLDANPDYFFNDLFRDKLFKLFKKKKIIISLRNPIDRCFSQWSMNRTNSDKKEFINLIKNKSNYYKKSLYYEHINFFIKNVPKKDLLIIFFEQWTKDIDFLRDKLSNFLEIENSFNYIVKKSNSSYNNYHLKRFVMNSKLNFLKNKLPNNLKSYIRNIIVDIGNKPNLNTNERALIQPLFENDIIGLSKIIDIPKNIWDDFKI